MTQVMANRSADVHAFMKRLDHPLKEGIERVRSAILRSNAAITEHIKWNAPSFCIDGEDRVTFNLGQKGRAQLIVHRGAKAQDSSGFTFDDRSGLVMWRTADRGIVALDDMRAIESRVPAIVHLLNRWMDATRAHR